MTESTSKDMHIRHPGFAMGSALALPESEVHLWQIDVEAVGADEDRLRALLSADELSRASRFHFSRDRRCFVVSRGWLRNLLARYLGQEPARLTFSYSTKGKPGLGSGYEDGSLQFNVSHSAGIALLAFTRRREIGVDIEQIRRDFDLPAIANRFFSVEEQEQLARMSDQERPEGFFRCWTRKEAYIKATGDGLSLPLSQFDVSLVRGDRNALLATRPDASEAARWRLQEVPTGAGYIAALCVRGNDWHLREWSGDVSRFAQTEPK